MASSNQAGNGGGSSASVRHRQVGLQKLANKASESTELLSLPSDDSSGREHPTFINQKEALKHKLADEPKQLILVGVTIAALLLRLFSIHFPAQVVFDEVHFGGFASRYLRREYYFDVHPPLGKMLVALIAWLGGYDGQFSFLKIGLDYADGSAPYIWMRTWMAILGTASVTLATATLAEMGMSNLSVLVVGSLLALDNGLVTQVRYILLDALLFFFMMLTLYSWVKFRQLRKRPFTREWAAWMAATGLALGATLGVKMVGLFMVAAIGIATVIDLWQLADKRRKLSDFAFYAHFGARCAGLILLPILVYVGSFWLHFAILNKTGPGDAHMSPQFQATLHGNRMSTSSRQLRYGHTVRIMNKIESVYLHSHAHNIPQHHEDGKVSSAGQQVNGYPHKDQHNLWKIVPLDSQVEGGSLVDHPIKDGDHMRLIHMATGKALLTHDVASPLTRTNQEVTAVDPNLAEKYQQTIWKISAKGGVDEQKNIYSLASHFNLISVHHNVHLANHQKNLPAWGFEQRELNGEKRPNLPNCVWYVEDIIDPITPLEKAVQAGKTAHLKGLGFFGKLYELQVKMLTSNSNLQDDHPGKSGPTSWFASQIGLSFWEKKPEGRRIYLLGNVPVWFAGFVAALACTLRMTKEVFYAHRGWSSLPRDKGLLSPPLTPNALSLSLAIMGMIPHHLMAHPFVFICRLFTGTPHQHQRVPGAVLPDPLPALLWHGTHPVPPPLPTRPPVLRHADRVQPGLDAQVQTDEARDEGAGRGADHRLCLLVRHVLVFDLRVEHR